MAATGAPPAEGSNDPGTVWVTSSPVGAEVRLDGVVAGRTPIAVTIPAGGKHQLTVSQQGWSTFQRSLTRRA